MAPHDLLLQSVTSTSSGIVVSLDPAIDIADFIQPAGDDSTTTDVLAANVSNGAYPIFNDLKIPISAGQTIYVAVDFATTAILLFERPLSAQSVVT